MHIASLPLLSLPSPNRMLTVAAAPLRIPNALTMGAGIRSWGWLILKLPSELRPSASPSRSPSVYGFAIPLSLRSPVLVIGDLIFRSATHLGSQNAGKPTSISPKASVSMRVFVA